jgi:hypothetical protein
MDGGPTLASPVPHLNIDVHLRPKLTQQVVH